MKRYIIRQIILLLSPICLAQNVKGQDSIQLYYNTERISVAGTRQDHCVTIVLDGDSMVLTRKCYVSNNISKCANIRTLQFDIMLTFGFDRQRYEKLEKEHILCNYLENQRYITLDERVTINRYQYNEFVKIIDEIKIFDAQQNINTDELKLAYNNQYVVIYNGEISLIIDWEGTYDRSRDIERTLGLQRYSRCPCREIEIKEAKTRNETVNETAKQNRRNSRKRGLIP